VKTGLTVMTPDGPATVVRAWLDGFQPHLNQVTGYVVELADGRRRVFPSSLLTAAAARQEV
jgi:hypothetical protein